MQRVSRIHESGKWGESKEVIKVGELSKKTDHRSYQGKIAKYRRHAEEKLVVKVKNRSISRRKSQSKEDNLGKEKEVGGLIRS